MFETNTGACTFNGISDSFRAGDRLRAADDAHEFRPPMFHLGGQNVFYNRDDAGERGLAAMTVVQKVVYTWPGQTFGGNFESDGRSTGTLDIKTVQCDMTAQTCTIEVPTPGFALVFLTDDGAAGRQRAKRQSRLQRRGGPRIGIRQLPTHLSSPLPMTIACPSRARRHEEASQRRPARGGARVESRFGCSGARLGWGGGAGDVVDRGV
ncbi:hypothetical protein B0H13DRAFT_1914506 [Mycena leptocephala]|nr:hypothetical protein B0H13DRAFT_1914506 [Mycena leptocephala]